MSMTPKIFADTVGRKRLADAAGVGLTAVSNAVVSGRFPASWYLVCTKLALAEGIACPIGMFAMRVADPENVDAPPSFQGASE